MCKNFGIRMLYTDVYWYFYFHVFIHILFHDCLFVIVLSLRSDSDYNKEATYLLTYKTLKAYKVCAQDDMTAWIWSETDRPFVTVKPRLFNTSTRWICVSLDGTAKFCLRCLSTKMISWLLARFSFKLLFRAHSDSSPERIHVDCRDYDVRIICIFTQFVSCRDCVQVGAVYNVRGWSDCWPLYDMILADIVFITDISSWYLVWCEWASKKWTSQLCTWSGRSSWAILSISVWWRTVSKALLKSKAITITYGLVRSRCVTLCKSMMIAAVVEPVGLKANWSWKVRNMGGFWKAGIRRIDELADHSFLHDSCKDRCDWYRPKVGVLSRNCDFGNWSDPGLFELTDAGLWM